MDIIKTDSKTFYAVIDNRTGKILGSVFVTFGAANTHISDQMHSTKDYNENRWKVVEIEEWDIPENCIVRSY